MRKILSKLKMIIDIPGILLFIFLIPIIILMCIIFFIVYVMPYPFEIIRYKKSRYYEKFKKKYTLGITHDTDYKLINLIIKDNLNVNIVENKKIFYQIDNKIYLNLTSNFESIYYDEQKNIWMLDFDDHRSQINVDESVNEFISIDSKYDFNQILFLINKKFLDKNQLSLAMSNNNFVIYSSVIDIVGLLINNL